MTMKYDATPRFGQVSEAEAQGRVREIYDDFRSCLGAPMVDLIYRHMATVPGCLEWAWATLRPMFASDAIPSAARSLAGSAHNAGGSVHTSKYKPWELSGYHAFAEKRGAQEFAHYLKTGSGKEFANKRLW